MSDTKFSLGTKWFRLREPGQSYRINRWDNGTGLHSVPARHAGTHGPCVSVEFDDTGRLKAIATPSSKFLVPNPDGPLEEAVEEELLDIPAFLRRQPAGPPKKTLTVSDANIVIAWSELIPLDTRSLVGLFDRKLQWTVLRVIRACGPAFVTFLEQERDHVGFSYVEFVLQLSDCAAMNTRKLRRLGEKLMHQKRAVVVTDTLMEIEKFNAIIDEHPLSSAECRWIIKSKSRKLSARRFVDELLKLRGDPLFQSIAASLSTISEDHVHIFQGLHPAFRGAPLIWCLGEYTSRRTLSATKQSLRHLFNHNLPEQIVRKMARPIRNISDHTLLIELYQALEVRVFAATPFPPPPVPGTALLEPIDTYAKLEAEARKMNSCVLDYLSEIHQRTTYFYAWHGRHKATVQVRPCDFDSTFWIVSQALGKGNKRTLDPDELSRIQRTHYLQMLRKDRVRKYA